MFLNDKGLMDSMTVWGAAAFAALQSLESASLVPPGVSVAAMGLVKAVAALVTVIGLRRAVGASNAKAAPKA